MTFTKKYFILNQFEYISLNEKLYNKVLYQSSSNSYQDEDFIHTGILIREDFSKLFVLMKQQLDSEFLLYDFDVKIEEYYKNLCNSIFGIKTSSAGNTSCSIERSTFTNNYCVVDAILPDLSEYKTSAKLMTIEICTLRT